MIKNKKLPRYKPKKPNKLDKHKKTHCPDDWHNLRELLAELIKIRGAEAYHEIDNIGEMDGVDQIAKINRAKEIKLVTFF